MKWKGHLKCKEGGEKNLGNELEIKSVNKIKKKIYKWKFSEQKVCQIGFYQINKLKKKVFNCQKHSLNDKKERLNCMKLFPLQTTHKK